jgi:hypothetical protein
VVLNFNADQGTVICGSSNLGPEQENGDNLLVIRDPDVVMALDLLTIIKRCLYHGC